MRVSIQWLRLHSWSSVSRSIDISCPSMMRERLHFGAVALAMYRLEVALIVLIELNFMTLFNSIEQHQGYTVKNDYQI